MQSTVTKQEEKQIATVTDFFRTAPLDRAWVVFVTAKAELDRRRRTQVQEEHALAKPAKRTRRETNGLEAAPGTESKPTGASSVGPEQPGGNPV